MTMNKNTQAEDSVAEKSTNETRLIAQDVTRQQAQVCEARRDRLDDKLAALAIATADNTQALEELSKSVASLSATVTSLAATVAYQSSTLASQGAKISDHDTRLAVMTIRVSVAAIIGGSLPAIVQWIYQAATH